MTNDQAELIIAKKNAMFDLIQIEVTKLFATKGRHTPDLNQAGKLGTDFNNYVRSLIKE